MRSYVIGGVGLLAIVHGTGAPAATETFRLGGTVDLVQQCARELSDVAVTGGCVIDRPGAAALLEGRAGPGGVGVRAQLRGEGIFPDGASSTPILGMSASIVDTLTFGIASGSFVLPFDIAGTQSVIVDGPVTGLGGASVSTGVFTGTGQIFGEVRVYDGTTSAYEVRDRVGTIGVTPVTFDIVAGKASIAVTLNTSLQCKNMFDGTTCEVDMDFFNSVRFLGGTVFDDQGVVVANPNITSESGFDYLVGAEPHEVSSVPLPPSALLLLAGLTGLARISILRKAPRKEPSYEQL